MSAPKHAPGPWSVVASRAHPATVVIRGPDGSFIGNVASWISDPNDALVAAANARLIAAAPELLEALEMVMRVGRIDDNIKAMDQVAAAIAKARGEA